MRENALGHQVKNVRPGLYFTPIAASADEDGESETKATIDDDEGS